MPIYEYECLSCGKVQEVIQKFNDKPLALCPSCGGAMKKAISNSSFILKGTGWYKTDYASPVKKKTPDSDKKSETKTEAKIETKTESKAEAAAKA